MPTKMNENCFAYHKGHCTALYCEDCTNCKFFKTKKQYYEDIIKAQKKLNSRLGFAASEMGYESLLAYLETEGAEYK